MRVDTANLPLNFYFDTISSSFQGRSCVWGYSRESCGIPQGRSDGQSEELSWGSNGMRVNPPLTFDFDTISISPQGRSSVWKYFVAFHRAVPMFSCENYRGEVMGWGLSHSWSLTLTPFQALPRAVYSVLGLELSELGGSHGCMPSAPLGPIFMTGLQER